MHAKIYLARRKVLTQNVNQEEPEKICVKVFKPVQDEELMGCAEEEYRVSQILKDHPNIIKINSF